MSGHHITLDRNASFNPIFDHLEDLLGESATIAKHDYPPHRWLWKSNVPEALGANSPGAFQDHPHLLERLEEFMGSQGYRWAFYLSRGESNLLFLEPRDAMMFKLTWDGR
jgi:hypothetical protein